jgi:hypothetical protein
MSQYDFLILFHMFTNCLEEGMQPRHRFMSAYEQKIEAPDKNYQYVLFACDPYETVGFKVKALTIMYLNDATVIFDFLFRVCLVCRFLIFR